MKPVRFLPASMQWRMTLAISLLFMVIVVSFGWLSLSNAREGYKFAGEAQLELTRRIAADLNAKLDSYLDGLESKGEKTPPAAISNRNVAKHWLDSMPVLQSNFDRGLFLFDKDGSLVASWSPDAAVAADPKFRRWVSIAMRLDEPMIALPFYFDTVDQRNGNFGRRLVLPMMAPFHAPDGRVTGLMAGVVDISRESLFGSIPDSRLGRTGYFFVSSWDGRTLAHPDNRLLLKQGEHIVPPALLDDAKRGYRGPVETVDQTGEPVLSTFVKMQATGWVLGANYPTREALAHVDRQRRDAILFIVLGTLVTALVTWFLMHQFVMPIRRFAKNIGAIDVGTGVSLDPVSVPNRGSELLQLGRSFNELVVRLNDERELGYISDLVFRNAHEGIMVTDAGKRIVSCNHAFEKITGYTLDEVRYRTPSVLKSGCHDIEFYRAMWQSILTTGTWSGEIWNRRKDGIVYPQMLNISTAKNGDGEVGYYVGIFSDITERKRTESDLADAKVAAESASLAKSQFLATMSHEIRTPMNGILGMAQLLQMPGVSDEERQECTRTILNSGQVLLTLLNDILDFSKVEAGKLDLVHAVFEPQVMLEEAVALFSEPALSKGLDLETNWGGEEGQHYSADPIRLRQMLGNLVSNAVKFTSKGFVRVEAVEVERRGSMALLEFAVTDTGIGIPVDKKSRLFQPFSQVDASNTREYGGTGLGLSIIRSLAELMGGSVGVESEPGKGSRFWFRIWADVASAGEGHACAVPGRAARMDCAESELARHVLLVEDNATNRKVLQALLGKLHIQTTSVENGQEAIDALMQGLRPDLVLMDCQMPVMDGFCATAAIRQRETETGEARLPIIALTASAFDEDRQRCFAAGMDDFLTKPINTDLLMSMLAKYGVAPTAAEAEVAMDQ